MNAYNRGDSHWDQKRSTDTVEKAGRSPNQETLGSANERKQDADPASSPGTLGRLCGGQFSRRRPHEGGQSDDNERGEREHRNCGYAELPHRRACAATKRAECPKRSRVRQDEDTDSSPKLEPSRFLQGSDLAWLHSFAFCLGWHRC